MLCSHDKSSSASDHFVPVCLLFVQQDGSMKFDACKQAIHLFNED
jgi:hypothetical protein